MGSEVLEQNFQHSCPSLVFTILGGSDDRFTQHRLQKVVRWMPAIEELVLGFCPNLNNKELLILGRGLTRLRRLQVERETAVSSRGFLRFLQLRGQNMNHLDIDLPSDFSLVNLRKMLELCPNLSDAGLYFASRDDDPAALTEASNIILPKTKLVN
ncbi:MAG: hypothetical protein ACK559_01085, partial [bacterium]